jgi:putative ABC transport system ATP-binding protein
MSRAKRATVTAAAPERGPAQPALAELVGVSKVYGSGDTAVRALAGVDVSIAAGEFVCVMGPSGSGKSTCMNILGCLDQPSSGSHRFRGVEVSAASRRQRALLRRHYLGFVFQGYNLLKRTTALENLELPLLYRRVPAAERRARAWRALEAVGLADRAHHSASELSGGQQQRVAIARALVTEPDLLLADEPTGNLDTARGREVMDLLARLNRERGVAIVLVTHEAEMAAYASRVLRFRDGRIVAAEARP